MNNSVSNTKNTSKSITEFNKAKPSALKQLLASLLPGIFLIGYNVGTGSITSMSKAGANFGLDLLWALLLSCFMTYYLMSLASRYTMVTSMTLLEGFRRQINKPFALFTLVILSTIIVSALMGVLGIVADVLNVWTTTWFDGGISITWCALFIASIVYLLVFSGDTKSFEKILALLVATMAMAFITTMFIEVPSLAEIGQGLIPKLPRSTLGSDNNSFVVMSGMVGTTVSVFVLVIRTGLVKELGWKIEDTAIEKRDAGVSATLMFIVSAAVMITAATTLNKQGLHLNRISEMIPMLEPLFGEFALSIFVIGVIAAGISSHLPNLLVIPWIISDYQGVNRNVKTSRNRILLLVLSLASLFGVIVGVKPIFLMLMSQACIAMVLPIVLGGLIYLTSKKTIMGQHINTTKDYVILAGILVFSLYMSSLAVQGLVADLSKL